MTNRAKLATALATVLVVAVLTVIAVLYVQQVRQSTTAGDTDGPGAGSSPPTALPSSVAGTSVVTAASPFTGLPVAGERPVLAVKIDNVRPARPQTGLNRADIVYVEPVEGGLSRIMAIFSGSLPPRVGPVRSARESDLELLAQFGRPGLADSGANTSVLSAIGAAPVVDLSPDREPAAYHRSSSRAAPHNLYADPIALLHHAQVARAAQSTAAAGLGSPISTATDIGFRFGDLPPGLGTPSRRTVIRYGAASTAFTWSAGRHRWAVAFDGRAASSTDGGALAASTVVIQYVQISASGLHDVLGNTTPYTHTVGSGRATVLRDGVAIAARWSRATSGSATVFSTTAGAVLPFAAGQVWVVYARS